MRLQKRFLLHDPSQVEYYRQITHNMVGRVLTKNHGITSRDKELYALNGFADLTREETNLLISQCEAKLAQYREKRGEKLWEHRTLAAAYISGTKKI